MNTRNLYTARRHGRTPLTGLIAVAAVTLSLVACAPEALEGGGLTGPLTSDSDASDSDTQKTSEQEVSQTGTDPQDCVAGVWKVDNDMFLKVIMSQGTIPGSFGIEGDLILRLAENGEYSQIKDEFTLLSSIDGAEARSVTTGAFVGRYTVDGDTMHFFDGVDVYHESYLDLAGIGRVSLATGENAVVDIFDVTATVPTDETFEAYNGAMQFTCTPDQLDVTVSGITSTWYPSKLPDMNGWK